MNYTEVLKQYFGYDSFRGIQREIVESIGSGNDTLGLMPTGGGKSITFQVPALAMEGVCIVVTPLISLMKDQVDHLLQRGIKAAFINSSMGYNEILQTLDNAVYGGIKFLYISPERISSQLFQTKVQQMKVCFIAVDEAHCISQWGYDFRPSYLGIAAIRELVPDVSVLALTATATSEVVEDIMQKLHFRKNCVYRMSFKRDNLIYVVRKTANKYKELVHILSSYPGSAIVYLRSRKATRELSKELENDGFTASFYHAGLDFAVKEKKQRDWQEGKTRVMVATNAFGMGIDKSDVRLVIHMDCPDSIEAYFQEAGRGGRDGKRAYAVLLYSGGDRRSLMRYAAKAFPSKDYIRTVYSHLAYFFQLAVNSGEGARYDFDVDRFCVVFKHHPSMLLPALDILQRAGYIEYELNPDNRARVMFQISREQLYVVRELPKDEELLLETLLRRYGDLFTSFSYIDFAILEKYSGLDEQHIHVFLKDLSHRGIIKYAPKQRKPYITYPRQRVDSDRLSFPKEIYEDLQTRMMQRIESVLNYAETDDECRSSMLLSYFGEQSAACGYCDVCLNGNVKILNTDKSAKQMIIDYCLDRKEVFLPDLLELACDRCDLEAAMEELHDDGVIVLDGSKVILNLDK